VEFSEKFKTNLKINISIRNYQNKINLSECQIKKNKDAYENRTPVKILLSYEQIEGKGKYKIRLNKAQKEKLDESKKIEKRVSIRINI
jgi:hypothetical protein